MLDKKPKEVVDDSWCHYSGMPSPSDYVEVDEEEWEANSTYNS
jgi:hypothetical protein